MNITLENISQEQYDVILRSLDLYSRILSGQLNMIDEVLRHDGKLPKHPEIVDECAIDIARNYFDDINGVSSYIGIHSSTTAAKRAYDLYKELRYQSGLEGAHSVYKYEPTRLIDKEFKIRFDGI